MLRTRIRPPGGPSSLCAFSRLVADPSRLTRRAYSDGSWGKPAFSRRRPTNPQQNDDVNSLLGRETTHPESYRPAPDAFEPRNSATRSTENSSALGDNSSRQFRGRNGPRRDWDAIPREALSRERPDPFARRPPRQDRYPRENRDPFSGDHYSRDPLPREPRDPFSWRSRSGGIDSRAPRESSSQALPDRNATVGEPVDPFSPRTPRTRRNNRNYPDNFQSSSPPAPQWDAAPATSGDESWHDARSEWGGLRRRTRLTRQGDPLVTSEDQFWSKTPPVQSSQVQNDQEDQAPDTTVIISPPIPAEKLDEGVHKTPPKGREHARRWEELSDDATGGQTHGRDHGRGVRSKGSRRSQRQNEDDDDDLAEYKAEHRRRRKEELQRQRELEALQKSQPTPIFLPEYISVADLSVALKISQADFLKALTQLGFEDITGETIMTGETAALIAQEYGFEPTVDTGEQRDLRPRATATDPSLLPPRPSVVTIMGHVDHGKTTLLDYLRKSSVAAQEHGGITQHIGAFIVRMSTSSKPITFLDTPGHAAFLSMRQRGANCTDIVVLVVAADDSVMPQTLEALKHARAANVPIIVAISKVDKPDARIDQVKADLARHGVEIEDFGGDVQVACVSGKTGQGMDTLEEAIVALSEMLDARAETDGMAEGWVLEASVKEGLGKAATVLIRRGTLRLGDCIVAGTTWARVRGLRNEAGVDVQEAAPGTPVEILGWRDALPAAGDEVLQAPDEPRAKTAIEYRIEMQEREQSSREIAAQQQQEREAAAAEAAKAAAEESGGEVEAEADATPGMKYVNFIIRGDVVGSVEAVSTLIGEIGNNEVLPRVLTSSAGALSESDVERAATSHATLVSFNLPVSPLIKRLAEDRGVRILDHSVIYHLHDEVKEVLSAQLDDLVTTRVIGEAEIAQLFPINIKGRVYRNIAGVKIRNGMVKRGDRVRILRKGEKVFDGKMDSLKHGKKDVSEMRKGTECGISFEDYQDFQVGDQIQTYEEVREKRTL